MSAKVIQIIETKFPFGEGTKDNPSHIVTQYWTFKGELLAEIDSRKDRVQALEKIAKIDVVGHPGDALVFNTEEDRMEWGEPNEQG